MMNEMTTGRTPARRAALALATALLGLTLGCGGNGFQTDGLASINRRGRGAMDGFVFVPSRQTATGQAIPHSQIEVYVLPRTPGDTPIATAQSDASGFYRIEGLEVDTPLLIIATDPFDPSRQLRAVISFSDTREEKRRNLTESSTLAARIVERQGVRDALSDAQVTQLEELAQRRIDEVDADVTTNDDLLEDLVTDLQDESFGTILVRIFSEPSVQAVISLNGSRAGTVVTALPPADARQVQPNELLLENVIVGESVVRTTATGFLRDEAPAVVEGGQQTLVERILLAEPAPTVNRRPVIRDLITAPTNLPFQGGQIEIRAGIDDVEGDAIRARAIVRLRQQTTAARQSTPLAYVQLLLDRGLYRGTTTLPGNPNIFKETNVIEVQAIDAAHSNMVATDPVQVFVPTAAAYDADGRLLIPRRFTSVQVSGVNPPPPPPEGGDQVDVPAALQGRWFSVQEGAGLDQLGPIGDDPDVLDILDSGLVRHHTPGEGTQTFQITAAVAQGAGQLLSLTLVSEFPFAAGRQVGQTMQVVIGAVPGSAPTQLAVQVVGEAGVRVYDPVPDVPAAVVGLWEEQTSGGTLQNQAPVPGQPVLLSIQEDGMVISLENGQTVFMMLVAAVETPLGFELDLLVVQTEGAGGPDLASVQEVLAGFVPGTDPGLLFIGSELGTPDQMFSVFGRPTP